TINVFLPQGDAKIPITDIPIGAYLSLDSSDFSQPIHSDPQPNFPHNNSDDTP
ncbi:hypothetical protein HAX54_014561, partial [Datura stramonium]|nr:hypothetical protein [Datura stramonium]